MQTRIGWPKSMVPNPIIHPSSQQKAKEEGWKKHDMDAIKQIDLIGYIKTYLPHIDRDLKKESPTSVAGPCVNCGSVGHDFSRGPVDRMFVKKTGTWYCRRCEKGGDIVDFVEFAFRTDFDGACKILEKDMGLVSIANIETYAPLPSAPVKKEESAWNYDQMTNLVFEAHDKLMANKGGEADMYIAYLDKRGLDPGTWTQFILGMREVWNPDAKMKLPALAIPWFLPTSSSLQGDSHSHAVPQPTPAVSKGSQRDRQHHRGAAIQLWRRSRAHRQRQRLDQRRHPLYRRGRNQRHVGDAGNAQHRRARRD
jgi:hypothetical protein